MLLTLSPTINASHIFFLSFPSPDSQLPIRKSEKSNCLTPHSYRSESQSAGNILNQSASGYLIRHWGYRHEIRTILRMPPVCLPEPFLASQTSPAIKSSITPPGQSDIPGHHIPHLEHLTERDHAQRPPHIIFIRRQQFLCVASFTVQQTQHYFTEETWCLPTCLLDDVISPDIISRKSRCPIDDAFDSTATTDG